MEDRYVNTLVTGTTQMGKTNAVLALDLLPYVLEERGFAFFSDPHRGAGYKVAEAMVSLGMEDRLILDDLGQIKWVCSPGYLTRSRHSDPIEREKDHREKAWSFGDALTAQRGIKLVERPLIQEWTLDATMCWLSQTDDVSLLELPWLFRPRTPRFQRLVDGCTNADLRYKFGELARFNSAVAFYNTVGPAARLMHETFADPAFRHRIEPTYALEDAVANKKVVIFLGGRPSTTRLLTRLMNLRLIDLAQDRNQGR